MSQTPDSASAGARTRIDKWLWAARFFKTRSLATQAVDGGKVRLNGERIKPAKEVKAGDTVVARIGEREIEVAVLAVADKRGSAAIAQTLYAESADSVARREAQSDQRQLVQDPAASISGGRPTKRDRRQLGRLHD